MSTGVVRPLSGITFSKQFPNTVEPLRGTFVAQQVLSTKAKVAWGVIAPVPWVPKWLATIVRRPYVRGVETIDAIEVAHPRYPVLPRRLLYMRAAPAMATASASVFKRFHDELDSAFVHAHGIYPSGSAARRLCAATGVPLVLSVHGSDLYTNLAHRSWEAEVRRTLDAAAAIVCVSTSLAQDVVALAGADPRRVTVVPNTFDAIRFVPLCRSAGATLRLVSVGRLVPEKGFDILLDAVAALVESGRDVSLVIVGAGGEDGALRRRAAELSLDGRICFAGALGGDQLVDALHKADIFVSSSRREGFGVAILEALATGLPVVATHSGGPKDLVGPDDGVLVTPGDGNALAEGIRNVDERLGALDGAAIARRAHERFAPDVVAAKLVAVYASVVAGEFPRSSA